jgi:hypothetical protein
VTRIELIARLRELGACSHSLEWLESLDEEPAQEAWDACERVDWMLWLAGHAGLRAEVISLAADYAEHVLPIAETWLREHAPEHAGAPRLAIEAARSGDGDRAYAARAAARAAHAADAAADAADAAADAVRAAHAADAAHAAHAARAAARAAHAADAAAESRWQLARLREVIAWSDVERGLGGAA